MKGIYSNVDDIYRICNNIAAHDMCTYFTMLLGLAI